MSDNLVVNHLTGILLNSPEFVSMVDAAITKAAITRAMGASSQATAQVETPPAPVQEKIGKYASVGQPIVWDVGNFTVMVAPEYVEATNKWLVSWGLIEGDSAPVFFPPLVDVSCASNIVDKVLPLCGVAISGLRGSPYDKSESNEEIPFDLLSDEEAADVRKASYAAAALKVKK